MSDIKKRSIEAITELRAGLFEIVAVAVLLALGINLLSSGIIAVLGLQGWAIVLLGITCGVLGIAYLLMKLRPANNRRFEFHGVLPISMSKERKVLPVERYDFSEKAAEYFQGLCSENKALAKLWQESVLGLYIDAKTRTFSFKKSPANDLVREALEYYVLDKLSLHLSAHFENNPAVSDDHLIHTERQHIPGILLQNRFLESFSKPMEQREAFLDQSDHLSTGIVSAWGKNGEIFEHFELILPRESVITRSPASGFEIKTNRFTLRVEPVFDGFSEGFPKRFEELYLGCQPREIALYKVDINLHVSFRLLSLFSVTGWEYYRWLDSFLDEMESSFSFAQFIRDIGWQAALSAAIATRHVAHERSP